VTGRDGLAGSDSPPAGTLIEELHAAFGAAGLDGGLWATGKGLEEAEKAVAELPETVQGLLHKMIPWGQDAPDEAFTDAMQRWWTLADAVETFTEQAVQAAKLIGTASRLGRGIAGPITVAGDISMLIDPPQTGAVGVADRAAAGVNAALVGYDTVGALGGLAGIDALTFSLPPVGVAFAVGTGLYLTGAYAYRHWAWFRDDLAKPIGHAVVHVADDIGHEVSSAWHDATSWL
jgi:hypothetical protein